MAIASWKFEVLSEYHDKPNLIGRAASRKYKVSWSTLWDFKQKIIRGEVSLKGITTKPKILLIDIETAPVLAHVWRLFNNNTGLNQIQADWYMLSWSAKWLGEGEVFYDGLNEKKTFKTDIENDIEIVKSLWKLFDQADIIIGHNIKRFDDKKTKARFLKHGLTPPSSYRMIDTLNIAKKEFALTSNKLDFLATFLGLKNKVSHEGHTLWTRCMKGDKSAWAIMKEYNIHDVVLLEEVYLRIRPWYQAHPNVAIYYNDYAMRCTTCGSDNVAITGNTVKTNLSEFTEYKCGNCGKVSRDGFSNTPKKKRGNTLRNIVS